MSGTELDKLFGLSGKVAVVAGASSGLGTECARALAKAGAHVGLMARRREKLEQVAGELDGLGVKTCAAPADVTEAEQIAAAYDAIEGSAIPEVPEDFDPAAPDEDALETDYGQLFQLLTEEGNATTKGALVHEMLEAADAMGIELDF